MTATYTTAVLPRSVHTAPSRPLYSFDRRSSHVQESAHFHGPPPGLYRELPPPMAPKPALPPTTLSQGPSAPTRQDSLYSSSSGAPDYHYPQSLPGVQDLLAHGRPASSHPPYTSPWSPPPNQTADRGANSYYNYAGPETSVPLRPPPDANHRYQNQPPRPFEAPVPHATPVSPYVSYPEAIHEYADARHPRHSQSSTASYMGGIPSPYTSSTVDEAQRRGSVAKFNRIVNPAFALAGPENHGNYLGPREIPGEGSFHVYEDGFRIPTHVDGEQVNPAWGLTKANKPRKRLALACIDCREKKIKCEPGGVNCLQCEKSKRPCRRPPAQQSQTDPSASAAWPSDAGSPSRSGTSTSHPTPEAITLDTDSESVNKRRATGDFSPTSVPPKKHCSISPTSIEEATAPSACQDLDQWQSAKSWTGSFRFMLSLEEDPYAINPDQTLRLLNLYFAHINNATYCLFPRDHFLRWVKDYPNKSQTERMVLYAMLAMASIFAEDNLLAFGRQCAYIAQDALTHRVGQMKMCIAQARMLIALYHFSKGSNDAAWDFTGGAIRAVTYARFHTEEGCVELSEMEKQSRAEFAFCYEQRVECRRRTFWSAFVMDSYSGAQMGVFKKEDIFVRLPCADDLYENSVASEAPFFKNDIIDPVQTALTSASPVSSTAWLIMVMNIWREVGEFGYRAPYRAPSAYWDAYETFYVNTLSRLHEWKTALPEALQYNKDNLNRSIQLGYAGTFISMHTLDHLTRVQLNRYVRHSLMPDLVNRNIQAAHAASHNLLKMTKDIGSARRAISEPSESQPPTWTFTTPYPGYAALSAIDVVSAGGLDTHLFDTVTEIRAGVALLRELAKYWAHSSDQLRHCTRRLDHIENVIEKPITTKSGCWLGRWWGLDLHSLHRNHGDEDDCIYGLGSSTEASARYFKALQQAEDDDLVAEGEKRSNGGGDASDTPAAIVHS